MLNKCDILNLIILFVVLLISCVKSGISDDLSTKEGKIVGGSPISIYKVKYQVSLRVKKPEKLYGFGRGHTCGGSVITQRLILTAAHCVQNYVAKDFTVVMGNDNRFADDPQQLKYDVQQIIKHQDFNNTTLINDIALLFINGYIPWNWPTVQAIQLNHNQTMINSRCTISGWGDTGQGQLSMNLLTAVVPIISYRQCYSSYGFIPESMICAGYIALGGIDSCQGDSGGPFVCNGLLTGIISWGIDCALANKPGVYTNVSAFNEWIVKSNSSLNYTLYGRAAPGLSLNIYLSILVGLRILYLLK